jgi:hypothetical protein
MARRRLRLGFENFARQLLNALSGIPGPRNTPADSTRCDALSRSLSHSFGQMTCGSPARAGDLGRGRQRNPLSYQQDKIVDFYHLKADSGDFTHSCAPEIVAGLAGGRASSERADPAVETGDGALSDHTETGREFAE